MDEFLLRTEGLGELMAALKVIQPELQVELREGLREGGRIVQEDARKRFSRAVGTPSARYSADHFRTYVRSLGPSVRVEQALRKTTGLRPDWGAQQMRLGLLPARAAMLDRVAERIDIGVGGLLRKHGF